MRKLLVQGARAVIYNVHRKLDTHSEWIKSLLALTASEYCCHSSGE